MELNAIQELVKLINDKLKADYPTVKINSTDIKDGFIRPSFFVDIRDNILISTIGTDKKQYEIDVDLIYFSSTPTNNKMENLTMTENLHDSFMFLIGNATITNMNFITVDDVLHCKFTVDFLTDITDKDTSVMMENLIFNQNLN